VGRQVSDDLLGAQEAARAYCREMSKELKPLGFPSMSAFAKSIARGTVSLMPTLNDAYFEFIGWFIWQDLDHKQRLVIFACYDDTGHPVPYKANQLHIKVREFYDTRSIVLRELKGYLSAARKHKQAA
jgi:hypothetical protein